MAQTTTQRWDEGAINTGTASGVGIPAPSIETQEALGLLVSGGGGTFTPTSVKNQVISTTSPTQILSVTPLAAGNYLVSAYFRVTTAATTVLLEVSWNDGESQTYVWVNQSETVGTYVLLPVFLYATTLGAITVTATVGTANQVFVSSTLLPL